MYGTADCVVHLILVFVGCITQMQWSPDSELLALVLIQPASHYAVGQRKAEEVSQLPCHGIGTMQDHSLMLPVPEACNLALSVALALQRWSGVLSGGRPPATQGTDMAAVELALVPQAGAEGTS